MYGVSVEAGSAPECVGLIQQAENAGVGAAWTNMGAAGPVDMMPVLAAAGSVCASARFPHLQITTRQSTSPFSTPAANRARLREETTTTTCPPKNGRAARHPARHTRTFIFRGTR